MPQAKPSSRSFTLGDLMVLVAATCAGLAMLRPYLASIFSGPGPKTPALWRTIEGFYGSWSCIAAWWMLALIFLQSKPPRPRWGRLARRPGHAACCVATVALAVGALQMLVQVAFQGTSGRPISFYSLWIGLSVPIGPAILGAWLLLALSGQWRPDAGWIDRLGRLLGWFWVGWILFWSLPYQVRLLIPPL